MCKGMCGLFVGVFVGALAYEILRKTDITKKAIQKVSDSIKSTKQAFSEGYESAVQPAVEEAPAV